MTDRDIWAYRADAGVDDHHLGGYSFETSDGATGRVVDEVKEGDSHYLVVEAPGGAGQRAVPVGVIEQSDHDQQTVELLVSSAELSQLPAWPWEEEFKDHRLNTMREWFSSFGYQGSPADRNPPVG